MSAGEPVGVRGEDWDNSPEAIADWVKWYDFLEPLVFSPQEQAELAAWPQPAPEYTLSTSLNGVGKHAE